MTALHAINVHFLSSSNFNQLLAVVNGLEVVVGVQRLVGLPPIRLDGRLGVDSGPAVRLQGRSRAIFDQHQANPLGRALPLVRLLDLEHALDPLRTRRSLAFTSLILALADGRLVDLHKTGGETQRDLITYWNPGDTCIAL